MKVLIVLCCALVGFVASDRNTLFFKLGGYSGKNVQGISYSKNYWAPKSYRTPWHIARLLCQSYGMELVRIETQAEHNTLREYCKKYTNYLSDWPNVDGSTPAHLDVMHNRTDWYFEDGTKIPYDMEWADKMPDFKHEKCLNLAKIWDWKFNDGPCSATDPGAPQSFICQELLSF